MKPTTFEPDLKCRRKNPIRPPSDARRPTIRFSPPAWAKLLYMRDSGPTEVGGFGICPVDDLLFVEEVAFIKQRCTAASVALDDTAVAEFFDEQVDQGQKPEQFGRIWIHTHPSDCAWPSWIDEETFRRVFGRSDWAVMFILAREGQTYARLRFNVGPRAGIRIRTTVDYGRPFAASNETAWAEEYTRNVQAVVRSSLIARGSISEDTPATAARPFLADDSWLEAWGEYLEDEDDHSFLRNGDPFSHDRG